MVLRAKPNNLKRLQIIIVVRMRLGCTANNAWPTDERSVLYGAKCNVFSPAFFWIGRAPPFHGKQCFPARLYRGIAPAISIAVIFRDSQTRKTAQNGPALFRTRCSRRVGPPHEPQIADRAGSRNQFPFLFPLRRQHNASSSTQRPRASPCQARWRDRAPSPQWPVHCKVFYLSRSPPLSAGK